MKFCTTIDTPVGQWLIPAGTVIEGNDPEWNGFKLFPMHYSVIALDEEAADALLAWHPDHVHLLRFAEGISPNPSRPLPVGVVRRQRTG